MLYITELLKNPIVSVALLGAMGTIFYSLKEIPAKIFKIINKKVFSKFVFTTHVFDYDELFEILETWLSINCSKEYTDVKATIFQNTNTQTPYYNNKAPVNSKKIPAILYQQQANVFYIKLGEQKNKKVFITKEEVKVDHATSLKDLFSFKYVIRGYKAKEIITKFLQDIVFEHFSKQLVNTVRVRTHTEYGDWNPPDNITAKPLNKIIIKEEIAKQLIEDLTNFLNNKEWYNNLCIPYKRTFCFYGDPGTGKTSLSLAIALYTQRDIYYINLNSIKDDAALQSAFRNISDNAVLLIEDIDACFINRETAGQNNNSISFSCLLNCMDGAFYKEGLITCITTNHLDKIDPALLRKGRTDVILKIDYPAIKEIETYLGQFYTSIPFKLCSPSQINSTLSMSAIQEICIENKNDIKNAQEIIIASLDKISNN